MALEQHARKFIGPADDLGRTICRRFNSRPKFISPANRHSQIDAKGSEATYDIRRSARSGMNHVQDPTVAVIGRQHSIRPGKLSKFGADGKSKHLDFFRRDSYCSQDGGALFVGNEKIIRGAAIPGRVDGNRMRDHHHTLGWPNTVAVCSFNFSEQIQIRRESANDDVGLKSVEQGGEMIF